MNVVDSVERPRAAPSLMARALKMLRVYHRTSRTVLAARIHTSVASIINAESGLDVVEQELIEAYCRVFDAKLSDLRNFAEPEGPRKLGTRLRLWVADKVLSVLEWGACDCTEEPET